MADNEHVVKITADTSQAEQNLDATSKKLDDVDQKAKKVDSSLSEMGSSLGTQAGITEQMSNDLDNMEKSLDNINSNNGQSAFAEMSNSLSSMSDMLDDFAQEIDIISESMGSNMSDSVQLINNALQGVKEEASDVSQECQNMCDAASNMDVDTLKDGFGEVKEKTNSLSQDMHDFASVIDSISMHQVVDEGEQLETVVEDVVKATEDIDTATSKVAADIEETKTPFEEMSEEAEEVVSHIENMSEKTSNINFDSTKSSVNELENEFDVLSQRAERLNETINMMNNFQAPTGQYKQMETDIESAENKLMQYMQEQQQMVENGTNINSPEWQQLQQNIDTTKQHVQELNSQMEELRTSGDGFNTTMSPDYSALESELQGLYDEYDRVEAKKQEFEELGLTGNALQSGYAEVDAELEKISQKMSEIIEKQDRMASEGTAFTPANDTAQFERYNESLAQTNMQMQNLQMQSQSTSSTMNNMAAGASNMSGSWQQAISSVSSGLSSMGMQGASAITSIIGASSGAGAAMTGMFEIANMYAEQYGERMQYTMSVTQDVISSLSGGMQSALSSVASKITSVFTNIAKKAFKKFGEFVKNATLELIGLGEHTNIVKKVLEELKNIWDQFINTMKSQIMRGISKLILEDLEEDLVVMAQFSDEFNEVMSDVIDAGKQLGLQLVAAIEPILNYLIPILTQAFEYIDWMMVQITKLTSALTGRDYYYEAIKGNSDYASSMDDSTASTDDYTQATNEATRATMNFQSSVMGFDKLNRLSGSSKGNGGSTGVLGDIQDAVESVGIDKPTLAKMQEEADEISSIGDQIWDAINNKDWYKAGYLMGAAVEEAFGWLDDVLGWSKNAEKFTKLVNAIIDACNGFIDYFLEDNGIHALTVGKYIGDMLNTLIECFRMLLDPETGINFEGLGEAIGYALIGAIKEINWYDLGRLIIEYFQMIPRILVGLFSTDIGTTLGEGVAEGIKGFADGWDTQTWEDFFEGLFNTIFDFIIAVFSDTEPFFEIGEKFGELLTSLIDGLSAETEGGDSKLGLAIEKIFDALSAAIKGFLTGFSVDAKDVETLVFTVLDSLANGFIELLSTENEQGQTITDKIAEFIKGAIMGVAESFKSGDWAELAETIINSLLDALGIVFSDPNMFTEIGEGIADVINSLIGGLTDDLALGTADFNDKVDEELQIDEPLFLGVDADTNIDEATKGLANDVEGVLGEAEYGINDSMDSMADSVESRTGSTLMKIVDSIMNLFAAIVENINYKELADDLVEIVNRLGDLLSDEELWDSLQELTDAICEVLEAVIENIPVDKLVDMFTQLMTTFVGAIAEEEEDAAVSGSKEAIENAAKDEDWNKVASNVLADVPILGSFVTLFADSQEAKAFREIPTVGFWESWKMAFSDDNTFKETITNQKDLITGFCSTISTLWQDVTGDVSDSSKETADTVTTSTIEVEDAMSGVSDAADSVSVGVLNASDFVTDGVSSASSAIADSATDASGSMSDISDASGSMATDVDGSMSDVTTSVDTNTQLWGSLLGSTADGLYTVSDDVDEAMGEMSTNIDSGTEEQKGIFGRFNDWLGNTFGFQFHNIFSGMNQDVDDTLSYTDTTLGLISDSTALTSADIEGFVQDTDISQLNLIEIVQAMLQNILDVFKTVMQQIGVSTEEFVVEFVDVFSSMEDAVESMCLKLETYLARMEKSISDFYANTSSTNTNNLSVKQPIYTLSIPALAGGGVVGDGQLFLANEQGVEAITSGANGSATVTNNDQMVRAITKGVQQAVENAMGGESRDNGDIVILVDGEELARASARGSRSMNKRTNPTVSYSYY